MKKIKKLFYILVILQLCCILFFACNKNISDDAEETKNPRYKTIHEVSAEAKEALYPDFPIRIFNPLYVVNNLGIDKLDNDDCKVKSVEPFARLFVDWNKWFALPAYTTGDCGISEEYFDVFYKDIFNQNVNYGYKLEGFSYNICIKKNGIEIFSSTNGLKVNYSLDDSGATSWAIIDSDFSGFIEGEYINTKYDFLNGKFKYQAEGSYKNLFYKTITTIVPFNKVDNISYIKNMIRVEEIINGYNVIYYICDLSTFENINITQLDDPDIAYISPDFILNSLRDKTINIAESFIDHSLDYIEVV